MGGSGFKMSKSELNMSGYRLNMRATGLKKTGNSWEQAVNEWQWVAAWFSITHMAIHPVKFCYIKRNL